MNNTPPGIVKMVHKHGDSSERISEWLTNDYSQWYNEYTNNGFTVHTIEVGNKRFSIGDDVRSINYNWSAHKIDRFRWECRWFAIYTNAEGCDLVANIEKVPKPVIQVERDFEIDVLLKWIHHIEIRDKLEDTMIRLIKEHKFEAAAKVRDEKYSNTDTMMKLWESVKEIQKKYKIKS